MNEFERLVKAALRELRQESVDAGPAGCPSEETLGLFLEGNLAESRREEVETHLARCDDCLDLVCLAAGPKPAAEPEAALLQQRDLAGQVRELVKRASESRQFDLVIRFVRGVLEVVQSTLAPLPSPALATVRGAPEETTAQARRLEKRFAEVAAEIQIGARQGGTFQIELLLRDTRTDQPADGLRITLTDVSRQRELRSKLAEGGVAGFQDLPGGDYGLAILKRGRTLGTMALRLLGPGK